MWIARALMALAVLATLGTAWAAVGDVGDPPARPAAAESALGDDDGGEAMFSLAAVGPGDTLVRCIRVTHGGDRRGDVSLAGRVRGALADDVGLVVERGTGGGFGDCGGFRGEVVYRGTLDAFADVGRGEPWRAGPGDRATYRFTVSAPPGLAATPQRASVDFDWSWRPAGDGPGGRDDAPPRDPAPVVAQAHGPAGPPTAAAGAGAPGAEATAGRDGTRAAGADRPAPPVGAGDGRTARGPATGAPGDRAARAGDGGPSLGERIADLAEQAGRVAAEGVKRAAFPLLLLLALVLFLVAQNRIDSRDPKLALAPVHRDHDLPFVPFDPRGPQS